MTDTLIGESPLPGSGEGVVLRFRLPDCGKLQEEFGAEWFTESHERLNRFDIKFIEKCLELGAKKDGKPHSIGLEDLNATIAELCIAILDALYLAIHGKKWEDYLNDLNDKYEAAKKAAEEAENDPSPSSPESSSDT